MKNNHLKAILITIGVFILGFANYTFANPSDSDHCDNCPGGGPGTESCSVTIDSITYSVTCKDGYYACCNPQGAKCCAGS